MPNKTNELFARLNLADFQHIERHIRTVEFQQGFVLAHTHQLIQSVYFPHSGIISCVVEARNGDAIETGMIGKDGVFGAGQAYDHKISLNKAMIQVPGTISVMDSNKAREIGDAIPSFRALLMDYDQFLFGQVQQSAAC